MDDTQQPGQRVHSGDSGWSEADSTTFLDVGDVAVPARREQMDVMLSLLPAGEHERFVAVELCCGEGLLAEDLLQRFSGCHLEAFDGSETMLERARDRLRPFGSRVNVRLFNLDREDWLASLPSPIRCILSSLALHHLDGDGKRRLFHNLWEKLEPSGALLIADIIAPPSDLVRSSFADAWDEFARQQSLTLTGSLAAYEKAVGEGWNYHVDPGRYPEEAPSLLFDQLKWLAKAGFSIVDCFWMRAGHAIYGGYR